MSGAGGPFRSGSFMEKASVICNGRYIPFCRSTEVVSFTLDYPQFGGWGATLVAIAGKGDWTGRQEVIAPGQSIRASRSGNVENRPRAGCMSVTLLVDNWNASPFHF